MKEMIWNKEEALKRIAFLYQETEQTMKHEAAAAVTAPSKRMQQGMFDDACEKKLIIVGLAMAAEVLGIKKDDLREYQADEEEKNAFIKAITEHKRAEMKEKHGLDLEDLLSDLLG